MESMEFVMLKWWGRCAAKTQLAEKVLIGVVERCISHATNDADDGI